MTNIFRLNSLVVIFGLLSLQSFPQHTTPLPVVPAPAEIKVKQGNFTINGQTMVLISEKDNELEKVARFFVFQMQLAGGPDLKISVISPENKNAHAIFLNISGNKSKIPSEGYELKVTSKHIQIHASGGAGLFYGIQTLLQLFPPEICQTRSRSQGKSWTCLLYTSPSPRDGLLSRMPSSA